MSTLIFKGKDEVQIINYSKFKTYNIYKKLFLFCNNLRFMFTSITIIRKKLTLLFPCLQPVECSNFELQKQIN